MFKQSAQHVASYYAQTYPASIPLHPTLQGSHDTEVLIIGAGFSGLLDHVLSVHATRKYKTDPAAYAIGPHALGLPPRDILFVSSNGWDAIGATWYGFTTLWVNRSGAPLEQLDKSPSRTGSSLRDVLDFFPKP